MSEHGNDRTSIDLAALREHLATKRGPEYWRSLEEVAQTDAFRRFVEAEFPGGTFDGLNDVSRRRFLQLMGASVALAGAACTKQPREAIVPYVEQPEQLVPGDPLFFATALPLGGVATGVLVESHEGRPTKVEGNPDHPASLGATDAFAQAAILELYDPDRSQVVSQRGRIRPWSAFVDDLSGQLGQQASKQGAGLSILTRTVTSPTLAAQIRRLLEKYPRARWYQYEPMARDNVREGARLAFGELVETQYRIAEADVILSLDADFLCSGPGGVRHAKEFARRRRVTRDHPSMNRLYAVESTPTTTGAKADHRLPVRAAEVENVARGMARELGLPVKTGESLPGGNPWVAAVARDLERHRGRGLVVAGEGQPPFVHALAHAMNDALGNVGRTVVYSEPVEAEPVDQLESLRELSRDIDAGDVEALVILGANPVYEAPADLEFASRLRTVPFRAHLGLRKDETSILCDWHVAEAHPLESWSDVRAWDGTVTILQPLIAPLYDGKTPHEVLSVLLGESGSSAHDVVRAFWKERHGESGDGNFETFWRRALHDGIVPGTAAAVVRPRLRPDWTDGDDGGPAPPKGVEIQFRPDPTVYDGRFANNGWLQELPKPLTKLTWDNAAMMSPKTAEKFGVANEDVVELRHQGRSVKAPVWVLPGQPEDSVLVHLGYGRNEAGQVGNGAGFDGYRLRTSDALWFGAGLEVVKADGTWPLATTQMHHSMEGRELVRSASLDHYREHPDFAQHVTHVPGPDQTLYSGYEYDGHKWAMTIDLAACIGCNACTIACVAENNISVVGKDQVRRGREMHWIRVDRYYKGDLDNPETVHQPVPCMHCENAPCEPVCPVGATVHSDEGLNDMVYNRCVGTRYCSNNCPYKVRRFNFYLYSDWNTDSHWLGRNPDVTVRSRGVMEKCTYCVQRISRARIEAKREERSIRDGDVVTACQQACPTEAIVFGDANDPEAHISETKADPRNYGILEELNTRPRTTYLAIVRNPNPELEEAHVDLRHG